MTVQPKLLFSGLLVSVLRKAITKGIMKEEIKYSFFTDLGNTITTVRIILSLTDTSSSLSPSPYVGIRMIIYKDKTNKEIKAYINK